MTGRTSRDNPETTVAPDGSPVAVYLHLPESSVPALVDSAIPPRSRVLDLGCGVGRIAIGLTQRGHSVVGVDNEPAMLRELPAGVRGVLGDVRDVRLGRAFDVVLLASNFLNDVDGVSALLATAREHLVDHGLLLAEVYPPGLDWPSLVGQVRRLREVDVEVTRAAVTGDVVDAEMQYRVGAEVWRQPFVARMRDEAQLARELAEGGFDWERWLDASDGWFVARRR